ncbi:MAG: hypothetical protein ACPG44_05515 [Polaribacter sp.]
MNKNQDFLYKTLEDKTIVWFKSTNKYLVLENTTADILKRLHKRIAVHEIATTLSKKLDVPLDKTTDFILDFQKQIYKPSTISEKEISNEYKDVKKPNAFEFTKFYKVNNIVFKVDFYSEYEVYLVHPKFAHLEIETVVDYQHEFIVFTNNDFTFLLVNNAFIGAWNTKDIHFFQGKFSMEFTQKIHQKKEKEWMGVFHASAVSNQKKAIMFLGDSGYGKSTSLAILQANGFTCLADDFVPVDIEKREVYSFPASISIKKNSLQTLLPIYPELENSAEYHFKRLNKVVRYLEPNNNDFFAHLPCKDLVFIRYQKDSEIIFTKISKIDAFQKLIPDSWISPIQENAEIFLEWFDSLHCYELIYSDNSKMIQKVAKIFNNDDV